MSEIFQIPCPPKGFVGTSRYTIRPRDKRDFHSVLDAKKILAVMDRPESIIRFSETSAHVVLETDHPIFTGRIREEIRYEKSSDGLVADSLSRDVMDAEGNVVRREVVAAYLHPLLGLPLATYPEVTLPFILGFLPLDGKRKSLYAWINDRFVAKLYVERSGHEVLSLPIGKRTTTKVLMYPDLNDWVSLGSVLTRLAKPFIPKYKMWFDDGSPYRLARFEGPYGPPGAPEIVLELASTEEA